MQSFLTDLSSVSVSPPGRSVLPQLPRNSVSPVKSAFSQELLVPVFKKGKLVYELPTLDEIRRRCAYEVSTLLPEVKLFDFPHQYYVDLSEKLMALKDEMLEAKR